MAEMEDIISPLTKEARRVLNLVPSHTFRGMMGPHRVMTVAGTNKVELGILVRLQQGAYPDGVYEKLAQTVDAARQDVQDDEIGADVHSDRP